MQTAIYQIQKFLALQPDAKVAQGMYWTGVWVWVALNPAEAYEKVAHFLSCLL